jgi:hypothetical protein
VLGTAAFALSKAVSKEKVGTWIRDPFVDESTDGRPPRHGGVRGAVGELLTCSRCLGAWSSLGLVGLRLAHPPSARVITPVLAVAGLNDFLQAGFNIATGKANQLG